MVATLQSHSLPSALPLNSLHNNEQQKTKDIMVILVLSFDTIRCELKKTKYIQNSIHSNELSSATIKGHSSFLTMLPLHKILENYSGIAFKARHILSTLSKFSFFFFSPETGIWGQIRAKTNKSVNTLFKQGINIKLVARHLN